MTGTGLLLAPVASSMVGCSPAKSSTSHSVKDSCRKGISLANIRKAKIRDLYVTGNGLDGAATVDAPKCLMRFRYPSSPLSFVNTKK